ncbi:hypothetical protein [Staphylococcus saprophyticus]|uniref:hypothetical protein n=1 Tax=Staphylococcus saprophyticus TaxID=29385 RepID=UPI0034C68FDE
MNKQANIVIPNENIGGEAVGYLEIKVVEQTTENHEIFFDEESDTPLQFSFKDDRIDLGTFLSKQDQSMIINHIKINQNRTLKIFKVTLNQWKPRINQ